MPMERELQLLRTAYHASITSPKELANFMAQITVESGYLSKMEESFRYPHGISQIPSDYAHRNDDATLEAARLAALNNHPEKLAELMYGGRMGNNNSGDGYIYRGRGYIQLTGKDNYDAAGNALGIDLISHPDMAAKPENAEKIAVWFWKNKVPAVVKRDVTGATQAINGGFNGIKERRAQFSEWENALTPEVMEELKEGKKPELPAELSGRLTINSNHHKAPLRQGIHDVGVKTLQTELATLGYTDNRGHPLKADGEFGLQTHQAVQRFQHDHRLAVDGKVGLQTQQALDTALKERNAALTLDDPHHPDHALFEQALAGVRKLDAQQGRTTDQHSLNLATTLTVQAKREGLSRIDRVLLSDDASRTFAAQDPSSFMERSKVAAVGTVAAVHTPMAQSSVPATSIQPTQPPLVATAPEYVPSQSQFIGR